jgi:hypothetical protein
MSTRYNHPVYGPERPAAAQAAINELAAAESVLTGWSDYDTAPMRARYNKAREDRACYSEYGTSFDDHAKAMYK